MAQHTLPAYYARGHSDYTVATQKARTADSDAAFLIPHIKRTDAILDVGCGPGTITISFAKHASEGKVLGIDISPEALQKARALAASVDVPTEGRGSVVFEQGDVLGRLPYADDSFDVVYASQVLGHVPPPDLPVKALKEMCRVLKPGGILATRDEAASHFYPRSSNLDELWTGNQFRASRQGRPETDATGTMMPALFRAAGLDANGGRVRVGAGTKVFAGAETRKRLAWRARGQLSEGDPFRQSWLDAGIGEGEIRDTLAAVDRWAATEDAWFASLQCEMLAWK